MEFPDDMLLEISNTALEILSYVGTADDKRVVSNNKCSERRYSELDCDFYKSLVPQAAVNYFQCMKILSGDELSEKFCKHLKNRYRRIKKHKSDLQTSNKLIFTEASAILQEAFLRNPDPSINTMAILSKFCGITLSQTKKWV